MEYIATLPVDFWVTLATLIATLVLGQLSKKYTKISSKLIPLQNIFIGVFVCFVEYLITKDFNAAVIVSGVYSGGIYDICKSLLQLVKKED